jgi:hypothetical protein
MASTTLTGVQLTDSKLFRQSCYVDGAWVNARGGATINVDNPATGRDRRHRPEVRRRRNARRDRGRQPGVP